TEASALANAIAIALPMPLPPPVTMATWPARLIASSRSWLIAVFSAERRGFLSWLGQLFVILLSSPGRSQNSLRVSCLCLLLISISSGRYVQFSNNVPALSLGGLFIARM